MPASIVINQFDKPAGSPSTSRDDLALGVQVDLDNSGAGTTYVWEFISIPPGSTATLPGVLQIVSTAAFTPDKVGSYLIRLTVDGSSIDTRIAAVRMTEQSGRELDVRIPAAGEQIEFNANPLSGTDGWHEAMYEAFIAIDDKIAALNTSITTLNSHVSSTSNPHQTTLGQAYNGVGAGAGAVITASSGPVIIGAPSDSGQALLDIDASADAWTEDIVKLAMLAPTNRALVAAYVDGDGNDYVRGVHVEFEHGSAAGASAFSAAYEAQLTGNPGSSSSSSLVGFNAYGHALDSGERIGFHASQLDKGLVATASVNRALDLRTTAVAGMSDGSAIYMLPKHNDLSQTIIKCQMDSVNPLVASQDVTYIDISFVNNVNPSSATVRGMRIGNIATTSDATEMGILLDYLDVGIDAWMRLETSVGFDIRMEPDSSMGVSDVMEGIRISTTTSGGDNSSALKYGIRVLDADAGASDKRVISIGDNWDICFQADSGEMQLDGGPLRFGEQSGDPTNVTDKGFLYSKDLDGYTELYYLDNYGDAIQITDKGQVTGGGGGGGGNDLTGAYNQGGAGAGRVLVADAGTVEISQRTGSTGLLVESDTSDNPGGAAIALHVRNELASDAGRAVLAYVDGNNHEIQAAVHGYIIDFGDTSGDESIVFRGTIEGDTGNTGRHGIAFFAENAAIGADTQSTRTAFWVDGSAWDRAFYAESGDIQLEDGYLRIAETTLDPIAVSNKGFVYTKDVSTVTELYYKDSAGNAVQLTDGGAVAGSSFDVYEDEFPADSVDGYGRQSFDLTVAPGASTNTPSLKKVVGVFVNGIKHKFISSDPGTREYTFTDADTCQVGGLVENDEIEIVYGV